MKRVTVLFLTILLVCGIPSVFAAVDSESLRNNQYFAESLRLSNLARLSFEYGDYDASVNYAEEALRYARLSDEYVALRLKETNEAIVKGTGDVLPAQYTVRPWASSGDWFWNIAGRDWVYGDPRQWRLIYNANKAKLSDPNNPNLIKPGMVLDIPSLRDEVRQGMWTADGTYNPLRK
jgi:hypothetical protein